MIRPEFKKVLLDQRGAAIILWSVFTISIPIYLVIARKLLANFNVGANRNIGACWGSNDLKHHFDSIFNADGRSINFICDVPSRKKFFRFNIPGFNVLVVYKGKRTTMNLKPTFLVQSFWKETSSRFSGFTLVDPLTSTMSHWSLPTGLRISKRE